MQLTLLRRSCVGEPFREADNEGACASARNKLLFQKKKLIDFFVLETRRRRHDCVDFSTRTRDQAKKKRAQGLNETATNRRFSKTSAPSALILSAMSPVQTSTRIRETLAKRCQRTVFQLVPIERKAKQRRARKHVIRNRLDLGCNKKGWQERKDRKIFSHLIVVSDKLQQWRHGVDS